MLFLWWGCRRPWNVVTGFRYLKLPIEIEHARSGDLLVTGTVLETDLSSRSAKTPIS